MNVATNGLLIKKNMKLNTLVIVEWDDAHSAAPWKDLDDVEDFLKDDSFKCSNVGWLVAEDKDGIVLASRKANCEQYGLLERLPKRMITKIKKIKL